MNRLVEMSRQLDKLLKKLKKKKKKKKKLLELWLFVILGIFILSAKYLKNCKS